MLLFLVFRTLHLGDFECLTRVFLVLEEHVRHLTEALYCLFKWLLTFEVAWLRLIIGVTKKRAVYPALDTDLFQDFTILFSWVFTVLRLIQQELKFRDLMGAFLMNNLVKLGLQEHQLVASALDDLLNLIKSVSYSFAIELMDVVNDSEVIIVGSHVLAIGLPHDLVFVFQLLSISVKLCFDEITIDFTFLTWSVWIDLPRQ